MSLKYLAATAALACLPFAAYAGSVDVYYIPSGKLEVSAFGGSGDTDGNGFGIKTSIPVSKNGFFINGEYQSVSLDEIDTDVNQFRTGGGWMMPGERFRVGGHAEYAQIELKSGGGNAKVNGYGIHGRVEFLPIPALNLHAQIGYLGLEDDQSDDKVSGPEFAFGGAYQFTPVFGAFVDYRMSQLSADSNVDTDFSDVRLGGRFSFGM